MKPRTLAVFIASIVAVLACTVARAQDEGEGAIVVRDTAKAGPAPIYAHAEGPDIESEATHSQRVAGITTPQTHGLIPRLSALGLLSHTYVFETSHGRVHVVYFTEEKQSGTVKTAWMDPADLQNFTYDCSCGLKEFHGIAEPCSPFAPTGIMRFKWNSCFVQASENTLAELGGQSRGSDRSSETHASKPEDESEQALSADTIAKLTSGGKSDDHPAEPKGGSAHTGKPSKALTNEDVVKLVKAELGDKIVIDKINASPGDKLDTSTDALIKLKKAGVSKAVIDAIVKRGEE